VNRLQLYHQLPYPFRSLAASFWGYYLRWWRYGSQTEALVEETLERDSWSKEIWQSWQEDRLAFILQRAVTKVPYYRSLWAGRRKKGDQSSWEILENWPILTKEDLRSNDPRDFLADDQNPNLMYSEHTSGTTGTPLSFYNSRKTLQYWYAIYEARIRHWNDVSRKDRWGIIGGQLVVPQMQTKPPYWVWNYGLNQLYLSAYNISPNTTQDYINAIRNFELVYLLAYPSALYSIALDALAKEIDPPKLKIIISNAEPLFPWQKKTIEEFFQCPVKDTYGMSENVAAAAECSSGVLHLFPDTGITEILNYESDIPVQRGGIGRIVSTGLINPDMPLIRYEVGDSGSIDNAKKPCSCGRNFPVIKNIEGRLDDMIITPDGRRIGRMDPAFKSGYEIKEAQIIQESLNLIKIIVVPTENFDNEEKLKIEKSIKQYVGNQMEVLVEIVEEIPRTKAGKFKAVVSHVKGT